MQLPIHSESRRGKLGVLTPVDSSDFRRGGGVRVQIQYDLPLATLPLMGWGAVQLHHEAVEPVDMYRSLF